MNQFVVGLNTLSGAHRRPLHTGEVHVFLACPAKCLAQRGTANYLSMLSSDELARLEQFRFEHLRNEFLVTRALCRTALSRHANVDAAQWQFGTNSYGKPEIRGPDGYERFRFNLSNVRELVACVIALDVDIGVDVEETARKVELSVAENYFSNVEFEQIRRLPDIQMRRRFLEIWTLKESYIKARGMGLSLPLDSFSFQTEEGAIRIELSESTGEFSSDWQFHQQPVGSTHLLAVAIAKGVTPSFRILVEEVIP